MNIQQFEQNDDEAERAQRRRTLGKSSSISLLGNDNLNEDQQGLQDCLKIFQDNKISKDNAWNLTLLDNMYKLIRSHHKTLKNFQIAGMSLEASTKIYGLRVDSVHSDVLRMSSGLGRMKSVNTNNDENDQANETGVDDNQNDDGTPKAIPKKKRNRKAISTVATSSSTLNSRLETMQLPDALKFKLDSITQESSSSNRLLLNTLQTKKSDLKLTMDELFWDSEPCEPIRFNDNHIYDVDENDYLELPVQLHIDPKNTLRQQMIGYAASNTPIDYDDDEEQPQVNNTSFNMSQCLDYVFDMAADVEPITNDNYAMDYMDYDHGNDFDDLTQDDKAAISACKGLRRKPTMIEDLRPSDTTDTKLEYSYRPLNNINQFWAGPSYWKYRTSHKPRESTISSDDQSVAVAHANKRKANRNKLIEPLRFSNEFERLLEDDNNTDGIFISIDSEEAQKFKKNIVYKRWDSKKLKLPTDLHIDRNLFNYFTYCPSISMFNTGTKPRIDGSEYDSDNPEDVNYSANDDSKMGNDVDDAMMDHINDIPSYDTEIPAMEQIPDSQNSQHEHEISQNFEGAPETIQKIDIQFARRAKVIDMKQMKSVCLDSIKTQCQKTSSRQFTQPNISRDEIFKEGAASFNIIYNGLPHMLTKTMAENLTPSVAFYSILHLANEHRLRLYKSKDNDRSVFLIRRLEE